MFRRVLFKKLQERDLNIWKIDYLIAVNRDSELILRSIELNLFFLEKISGS